MSYVDPAIAGTPTSGQAISSQWGRDVQADIELEEAQLLTLPGISVNQTLTLGILAAPTATVGTWVTSAGSPPSITNTSAALNDSATWTTTLVVGTYDILVLGSSGSTHGQVQFALGGTNIGSPMDQFSASSVLIPGINAATEGSYTFKATVIGKNVSSSGFGIVLTNVLLTRRT